MVGFFFVKEKKMINESGAWREKGRICYLIFLHTKKNISFGWEKVAKKTFCFLIVTQVHSREVNVAGNLGGTLKNRPI